MTPSRPLPHGLGRSHAVARSPHGLNSQDVNADRRTVASGIPMTDAEVREARASRPIANTGLTGAAGEYFVAAELSLRGWLATVTIKNAPNTDVLAQKPRTGMIVAIQTKTAGVGNEFQLRQKAEEVALAQSEWFVLVKLIEERTRPHFFIVPKNVVSGAIWASHRDYLKRPRAAGKVVKDTDKRALVAKRLEGYADRWDLLDHPANEAPLLIDKWYTDCVQRFGLPPGHPGWPGLSGSAPRGRPNGLAITGGKQ
jgi:hypothetical protein